jgi:hypothetical protein
MDGSWGPSVDTLDLQAPNISDQHTPLPSTAEAQAVNSNIFIRNMNPRDQERAFSTTSDTLRPSHLSHMNHYESAAAPQDEGQPLGSGNATSGPQLRKNHTKSRRGCYNCKKRRIKVHQTRQITRRKINVCHSVKKIIQSALNVPDVASNVNGRNFTSTKQ